MRVQRARLEASGETPPGNKRSCGLGATPSERQSPTTDSSTFRALYGERFALGGEGLDSDGEHAVSVAVDDVGEISVADEDELFR